MHVPTVPNDRSRDHAIVDNVITIDRKFFTVYFATSVVMNKRCSISPTFSSAGTGEIVLTASVVFLFNPRDLAVSWRGPFRPGLRSCVGYESQ